MNIYVVSLGCPKNRVDTENVLGILKTLFPEGSISSDDPHGADLILVNTCAFIQDAVEESIETILELAQEKGEHQVLAVMGCLYKRYGRNLEKELPEVDIFFGHEPTEDVLNRMIGLLKKDVQPLYPLIRNSRVITTPFWRSYVKVSEGCSNACTFCTIPKIRGPKHSRSIGEILEEVRILEEKGVKEITFVGQDLTAWGSKNKGLPDLIEALSRETEVPWLRFLYLNPGRLDYKTIEVMAESSRVCRYLDIPVQHASDAVLKRMGRHYGKKRLCELIRHIRSNFPDFSLRATVMVGFPGETGSDFKELLDFIQEFEFDHLGCFSYSDEEGTRSSSMGPKIPKRLAMERMEQVIDYQRRISKKRLKKYVGKRIQVLVEGYSQETELLLSGRSEFQAPEIDGIVYINDGVGELGGLFEVEITDALDYDLIGRITRPLTGRVLQSARSFDHRWPLFPY